MILHGDVVRTIEQFAATAYPKECCGAVIGVNDLATTVLPLPNDAREPRQRFSILPEDYRYAEAAAEAAGGALLGFYHSHPDAPATPSAADLVGAWPNLVYLIVAAAAEGAGELAAWRLAENRSRFEKETLTTMRKTD